MAGPRWRCWRWPPTVGPAGAQESAQYPDTRPDSYYSEAVEALSQDGVFADTECDEGFCPDDPLDRATMAVWTVRVLDGADPETAASTRFADVGASDRHASFIERFAELGVTNGCGDGTRFCPDGIVTRAEMAVFLSRAFNLDEGPDPGFADVAADAWYAPEVARLAASGITRGCGDSTRFCPDDTTTRAQMATFLFRALGLIDTPDPTEPTPAGAATYRDVTDTCAILTNDTITCWGPNNYGQANAPAGTYKTLSSGSGHKCAIATNNTITCWGENNYGQPDAPAGATQTNAPAGTYKTLSTAKNHSCAIATNNTITCWGHNSDGQTDAPTGTYKTVTTGRSHGCAIATDGTITCWGNNSDGQTDAPTGTYKTVTTSWLHSCAIATNNTITCWGNNSDGQTDAPAGTYKTVTTNRLHSCAIATNNTITCWGNNSDGQTDAPAGTYKTLSTAKNHSCAIATNNTITCWGNNSDGQTDAPTGTYKTVTTNRLHSCAIATNNTITCWGNNPRNTTFVCTIANNTTTCRAYNEIGQADPPQTVLEVAATQSIAPIDLSGGSRPDHVSSDVLDFDMIDASTGATVNLRSVVNGKTPLLFWLYSPY